MVEQTITSNGIALNVATAGDGPALLLVHGWPHTWRIWDEAAALWAQQHTVLAPDLRGIGGSQRARDGYDAATLAADLIGVLDALRIDRAEVVAIDAGVAPAFLLALEHPERVSALVLMEGLIGPLPGAEGFLTGGPPWWFGFHQVPGLTETVTAGNEAAYLDFFLTSGTHDGTGVPAPVRTAILAAYTGAENMRCGLELYRAFSTNGRQLLAAIATRRLSVPTLAVAGGVVGDALYGQLAGVADDLTGVALPECGHIVPIDQPHRLVEAVTRWRERG